MKEQLNLKKRQEILRSFFIDNGVHDTEKLINMLGISESTYFKTLREVTDLLYFEELSELQHATTSNALRERVKYDAYYQTQNFLGRLYQSKGIRLKETIRLSLILKLLDGKGELSTKELLEGLSARSFKKDQEGLTDLTERELSRYTKALVEEEMIVKEERVKDKRKQSFYSIRLFFDLLSTEELLDLYAYIQFCTYAEVPAAPGFLLLEKLGRHLVEREGILPEQLEHTIYQYPYCGRVLDEYMCYEILPMIENHYSLKMTYSSVKDQRKKVVQPDGDVLEHQNEIIPLKIIFDYHFARWYLVAQRLNVDLKEPLLRFRIDYIAHFEKGDKVPSTKMSQLLRQCEEELKNSWCVTYTPELTTVKVLFEFDHAFDKENFIKKKVEEQGQWGTITKEFENGSFLWEISVRGFSEIAPWLRSFGKSAIVIEPMELREKMIEDWKAVLQQYESCT